MTKRRTYIFPNFVVRRLEDEANRRILENFKVGTVRTGAIARDIICIALHLSLKEIKKMSKEEFAQACEESRDRKIH